MSTLWIQKLNNKNSSGPYDSNILIFRVVCCNPRSHAIVCEEYFFRVCHSVIAASSFDLTLILEFKD